jgi:hypothetical protein
VAALGAGLASAALNNGTTKQWGHNGARTTNITASLAARVVRAEGGNKQEIQHAYLDAGAVGASATCTSASLAAEDVRAAGGNKSDIQHAYLNAGAVGPSAKCTFASLAAGDVRAGGGSRQDGQRAFLDEGAVSGSAQNTSASLAAADVRDAGGSREEVQKTFLVSGATGCSALTTFAALANIEVPFLMRAMPAGNPSSASLVAAQARLRGFVSNRHRFGFEDDPNLYTPIEAFAKLETAHKLDVAANHTTNKVLEAMDLSIKRMLAARSDPRVNQWSTFTGIKFYTVAQPASEPKRTAPTGSDEEEEEEIITLSDEEEGEQPAPFAPKPASKPKGTASSSAAAEESDEESEPGPAPPPSRASTSAKAGQFKAFHQDNKSTIFCDYPSCKRFKGASKGGQGQGFSHTAARDKHHATHLSGGCDKTGKVTRVKKSK